MPHELPLKNLTREEWGLLIAATAAYRHNARYQALHMKLLAQHALYRQRTIMGDDWEVAYVDSKKLNIEACEDQKKKLRKNWVD